MKASSVLPGDVLPVASATRKTYRSRLSLRVAAILILIVFITGSLYLSNSVSAFRTEPVKPNRPTATQTITAPVNVGEIHGSGSILNNVAPLVTLQETTPSIATYADDCTTPKTVFAVGDTVCVSVTGFAVGGFFPRRLHWESPNSTVAQATDIETDPQTGSLVITPTFEIGTTTVDSRGLWRVAVKNPFFFYTEARTEFTVIDPANTTADLAVTSTFIPDSVSAGGQASFGFQVNNYGPDSSANIQLTSAVPANTTFVSFQQLSGPTFTCETPTPGGTGTTNCSITGLSANASATFVGVYEVSTGTAAGTTISNRADIGGLTETNPTGTHDLNVQNNFAEATTAVAGGEAGNCDLTCPSNVVVTADTTSNGQPGAFVTFAAASVSGSCGAVTNSPASGSFFAVGTHTITSTSEIGGASCFFTVTVLDTNPPTIMCPPNITLTAPEGATDFTLPMGPGTPSINASGGGTVTAVRSDDKPATFDDNGNVVSPAVVHAVNDPYPIGSTGIQWTVTDAGGRKASCSQTITIVAAGDRDPVTISCPANVTFNAPGGSCEATIPSTTIGTPSTSPSDDVTVTPRRSDDRPLSDPFPAGLTTITWTATDNVNGSVASCVQNVTVIVGSGADDTPPVLTVPANVNVTTSSCTALLDDELGVAQATDEGACNGSVTVIRTGVPAGFIFPTGTTTITYTATDSAGNTTIGQQLVTVTESPAVMPAISCPTDITVTLPLNSTATSMVVNYTAPTGTDNCGGATTTQTAGLPSGASFPMGTTTNTFRVTDASGNYVECSFTVTVLYNFLGFFQPVDNLPTLNVVTAGKAVPVKFSLSGDKGLNIFAANSPWTVPINCDSSLPQTDIEETLNAGGSSLSYDPTTDQYVYVWKTLNSWKNTCRQLVVVLNDGTEHRANFKFK